jgi:hypothetical protein
MGSLLQVLITHDKGGMAVALTECLLLVTE